MLYENILIGAKALTRQERTYLALRMLETITGHIDEHCELAIIDHAARLSGCDVDGLDDRRNELLDETSSDDDDSYDFAEQVRGDYRMAQMGAS